MTFSEPTTTTTGTQLFVDLGLDQALVKNIGYTTPSAIQAQAIPALLAGRDIVGQAQTGTGKTAAFALPLLNRLDFKEQVPRILVLAPTRELAVQVAKAFETYSASLRLKVVAIYGGESMGHQLSALRRGAHIVVGTPGRVMDHLRRKTLRLDGIQAVVLDEADEMLNRGFIEDIEWILEKTPTNKQVALFSATMPREIRRVAQKYLNKPLEIKVQSNTTTVTNVKQWYWPVTGTNKLDAISRILEVEDCSAALIFVRTKNSTIQLAEQLTARGHKVAALNGDMAQNLRSSTVTNLKNGTIDVLVATDVAARGLDIERISHVFNYDAPTDPEVYVHRIGRTGRAGRPGTAFLFLSNKERNYLRIIERSTNQALSQYKLPAIFEMEKRRSTKAKEQIVAIIKGSALAKPRSFIEELKNEYGVTELDIAAALYVMQQPKELPTSPNAMSSNIDSSQERDSHRTRRSQHRGRGSQYGPQPVEPGMVRYRLSAGRAHGMNPGILVGAIASASGIPGGRIGHIKLQNDYSTVELPDDITSSMQASLRSVKIKNQTLNLTPWRE